MIPDRRQDVESRHVRQHQVEDEEGDSVTQGGVDGLGAGTRGQRPIACGSEMVRHESDYLRLVIDDQDSVRYGVRFH